jgi:hypothetical protein
MKYIPIIKTGISEIRGVSFLDDSIKDNITPIFELTRSRKIESLPEGPISIKLDKIEEVFGTKRPFILDLTADKQLSNTEIFRLQNSAYGYKNWCDFLLQQKNRFPKIIPMLQIAEDENITIEENQNNFEKQIKFIASNFDTFFYRNQVSDDYYKEDLSIVPKTLGSNIEKLYCCIDSIFINQGRSPDFSSEVIKRIKNINEINEEFKIVNFSTAGTSFPTSISAYSPDDHNSIMLEEIAVWEEVTKSIKDLNIIYGDYCSINPERNDMKTNGWIPRIDVPTKNTLFYYRKRKKDNTYLSTYADIAQKIINDSEYQSIKNSISTYCWGLEQIEKTSKGEKTGLTPSFWISVRLNIHLTVHASNSKNTI